jgi:ferritin
LEDLKSTSFYDFDGNEVGSVKSKSEKTKNSTTKISDVLKNGDSESDAGTEAYLVRKIKEKVEEYDLRSIIFAILYRAGFDKNELLPDEK